MGFDFVVEYKRGKENTVADGLSRRGEKAKLGKNYTISRPLPNLVEAIKEETQSNPSFQQLM